jgi:chromosome partitioning protein
MHESVANRGAADIARAVRHIFPGGMLDLIPADITLTSVDGWLMGQLQRETVFERLVEANGRFFGQYDAIVTDSAPGTSLLSMNIMVACRTQLAVVWLDRESLKALPILVGNVAEINAAYPAYSSDIEIVANGYNSTYKHSKETLEVLVATYPQHLNENIIQQFSGYHKQQSLPGENAKGAIVEQDPGSPGAKAMFDLTKSLLGRYRIALAGYDESIPSARNAAASV